MAIDEAIFNEVSSHHSPPTLRFYSWSQPSISIGYFQNPATDLNLELLRQRGIPWVRRITGGRGIYHHLELTYSFSAPVSLPASFFPLDIKGSYQRISLGFARAFRELEIPFQLFTDPPKSANRRDSGLNRPVKIPASPLCFSTPSWYEILIDGKKVVGSAQKRFKKGFLQQGTLLLRHRFEDFRPYFRVPLNNSQDFIGIFDCLKTEIAMPDLEKSLVAGMEEELGIPFILDELTGRELKLAEELAEFKYGSEGWNRKRIIHDGGRQSGSG